MNMKIVILYGELDGEVYVSQPEGFVDPDSPDDVYVHANVVYGLKQASMAWYKVLSEYMLKHKFVKGSIVPNFVHIKKGDDIMLVQIYVDDIIFGSTNPRFFKNFENIIRQKFEMSMMEELKFLLDLHIKKTPRGILIYQKNT